MYVFFKLLNAELFHYKKIISMNEMECSINYDFLC